MKRSWFFALLLLVAWPIAAQLVYGVHGTQVVSMDPATGAGAPVGAGPSGLAYDGLSTYDPVNRRIFWLGDAGGGNTFLKIFSLATSTATQVTFSGFTPFIEYDPPSGLVYGRQSSQIISINPATGAVANVGPMSMNPYVGHSAYDPVNRRIFILGDAGGGNSFLATFSLVTSTSTQVTVSASPPFIEYDPVSGLVYGHRSSQIISINPATGAVANVGTMSMLPYSSHSTYDPVNRRIFLLGDAGGGNSILATFSLVTSTSTQVTVSGFTPFIEFADLTTIPLIDIRALAAVGILLALIGMRIAQK